MYHNNFLPPIHTGAKIVFVFIPQSPKDASEHFDKQTGLEASLIELKSLFESIHALVGRCGLPERFAKRAQMAVMNRPNPNRTALINAERRLEQITKVGQGRDVSGSGGRGTKWS